jgi:dynein heavy chain
VSDGEKVKLKGKGLYFIRTTDPDSMKDISKATGNDNDVLFGEISQHTVTSLNTVINQVYKPLVDSLQPEDWDKCPDEQKDEFSQVFDKFASELREALKSLVSNITLEKYESKWENDAKNSHTGGSKPPPEMLADFQKIFTNWSDQISNALDDADKERQDGKEDGPQVELDYWKSRMRKLTGVSEQLKSKNCRTVYDVLTATS